MAKLAVDEVLKRGVAEIISEQSLRERLQGNKPLRLKMGFDPSRPYLHFGNAVGIRKLRQFQELGHKVVLIVGDWTAQIGDPSGRDETRTMLSAAQVQKNAQTYMDQFFMLVDRSQTEIRWQSEWYGKFTLADVFYLTRNFTLADMLEHETFDKRFKEGSPLTLTELMYPALQGYDSVAIDADVEFGGTDQKFNILAGRRLQSRLGKTPQEVFLVPLLIGTDGRKMGKSFDNTVDLLATPADQYGKIMSLADNAIPEYFTLLTNVPKPDIDEMKQAMQAGTVNPRDLKMRLGREIVTEFHGPEAAREAEQEFVQVFQKRELPSDMPTFSIRLPIQIIDLLLAANVAESRSAARRLIVQGGVRIDDQVITNTEQVISAKDAILRVGRRRFLHLVPEEQDRQAG